MDDMGSLCAYKPRETLIFEGDALAALEAFGPELAALLELQHVLSDVTPEIVEATVRAKKLLLGRIQAMGAALLAAIKLADQHVPDLLPGEVVSIVGEDPDHRFKVSMSGVIVGAALRVSELSWTYTQSEIRGARARQFQVASL